MNFKTHPPRASSYSIHHLRHLRRTIGQRIHEERLRQQVTLARLAYASGVPEWRIDQYELGKNEIGLDEVLRLAAALGIPFLEIFT